MLCDEVLTLSAIERAMFDLIWREGPIARKDLADRAGVTGASSTRSTKRLFDLGLVGETVHRDGGVGSPTRPLRLVPEAAYTIGLTMKKGALRAALMNLDGTIKASVEASPPNVRMDDMAALVMQLLETAGRPDDVRLKTLGLGVAIPGYRASIAGTWSVHWDFPQLNERNLEVELTKRTGLRVYANRDAIAAALFERYFGLARTARTTLLIFLSEGIGGAFLEQGRPLLGAHGNAGGLGTLFPYDAPRPSAFDLEKRLAAAGFDLRAGDLEPGSAAANIARAWALDVTPVLHAGLNTVARLFDPELIILSGTVPDWILDILLDGAFAGPIQSNYTAELPKPRLVRSAAQGDAMLMGACAIPIASLLNS